MLTGEHNSWNKAFARMLTALNISPCQKQLILEAFADIAAEWMHLPSGRMPFQSGVCPDGAPLEFSIQFSRNSTAGARFISQPGNPDLPLKAQVGWSADRVVEFLEKWGGPSANPISSEALSIYPIHQESQFSGNFWFWLGLATDTTGAHAAKVYFNPWACREELSGAYAIYHLLKSAGQDTCVLQNLNQWIETGATPHIVGFNLQDNRISSVKIYLQAVWDRTTLNRLADETTKTFLQQIPAGIRMRPRGEVHLAIVCRSGHAPIVRFNLYCPDWFASDLDAISALPEWLADRTDRLEAIRRLCAADSLQPRRINFIGLDADTATIYMKVPGL
jgi:hypothetical protein